MEVFGIKLNGGLTIPQKHIDRQWRRIGGHLRSAGEGRVY